MAIVNTKGVITGSVGPVTYRRYRDKNVIQAKPKKYALTAASIVSYTEFGLISSTAATINSAFELIYRYHDGGLHGRTVSAVSQSIRSNSATVPGQRDLHNGNLDRLAGLEFNANSNLKDVLRLKPGVSRTGEGQVLISMPAADMKKDFLRPKSLQGQGNMLKIRFSLIAFNFRSQFYEYIDIQDIDYDINEQGEARELVIDKEIPSGCVLLLSMSLGLYDRWSLDKEKIQLNNSLFSPCALIDAWHSGEPAALTASKQATKRKPRRFSVSYRGNDLLAKLPETIKLKARTYGPHKTARSKAPKLTDPEVKSHITADDPAGMTGKRVRF